MFLKFWGLLFLCLGGFFGGFTKAKELSERVASIEGLIEALVIFQNEISYKSEPVILAARKGAEVDISGIFKEGCALLMELGAAEAFKAATERAGIGKEEKEVMRAFSLGLSAENCDGQIKNCALAAERLKLILEKAVLKKEKYSRLYISGGILMGAAGGIILL